jgi:glycosyltransferase involved in cell wall biosynthesis
MKIAVVTQYFPVKEQPYRGHSAYQTLLKLKQWADIEVFSPQARYPQSLLPKCRAWASTDLSFKVNEFKTCYFDYPAIPGLTRAINGVVCANRLEPLIRSSRPDLILNYWLYPEGFAAVRVGRKLGIPVMVKSIGSDLNLLSGAVVPRLAKYTMEHANIVMTVSSDLRRKAIAMGVAAEKIHAITNGCDTSVFKPQSKLEARQHLKIDPQSKLVMYVGRLDVMKGLRELVTACAGLSRTRSSLELCLVGDGPAQPELEELAAELGIRHRVHFAGVCDSQTVARWIAACDVFALPSYSEGCPNVVLEALNCGRPVVATNIGGIPDLVDDHCGILVPSRDSVALTNALDEAIDRTWDFTDISRRSYRGWEQVAQEVFELAKLCVGTSQELFEGKTRTVHA